MLSILTSILGSTGFGALLGAVGGVANRFVDIKLKSMELEAQKVRNEHELALRDKDLEHVKVEWESRERVASIEGETARDVAGYEAITASYTADKATYKIKLVDGIRGAIRPLITLLFAGFTLYLISTMTYQSPATHITAALYAEAVAWVFFQASVVIGWWFGNRPSGTPKALAR